MIFQSEKTLEELGDKVSEDEKADVKAAIEKLKSTVSGGNTEDIKADTEALEKAFYKLSEKLYAQANPQGDPNMGGGFDPNMGGGYDPNMGGNGGTYYDASYEDNTNK